MSYYILYKRGGNGVKIVKKRPVRPHKGYGFAEGSFKTKKLVCNRLGMMNRKLPNFCKKVK